MRIGIGIISIVVLLCAPLLYWPLGFLSIALAAFTARYWLALIMGLILDIAYGIPPSAPFLLLPFTLMALAMVALRYVAQEYVFQQGKEMRL